MKNKEGGHFLIGFIASCQSRSYWALQTNGASTGHPASVLAPESALGSLPSVALSSAQADRIITDLNQRTEISLALHHHRRVQISVLVLLLHGRF